jgi:hypothetical protein
MGTPATTSLIDDSRFWKVPTSLNTTLTWFAQHPPGGLAQSGSGSSTSQGATTTAGFSYDAPSSAAWTGATVQIGVAPAGPDTSIVRADGIALWMDPVPAPDNQPGPRMRVTRASGCPPSDRGFVGVTNPEPPLKTSLLPAESPTGALVCRYYGLNGQPFALKQKAAMDATAAKAFSDNVRRLPLAHLDGLIIHCPAHDGGVTVVALDYPHEGTVDLWMTDTGCATVSNGSIRASGIVPV